MNSYTYTDSQPRYYVDLGIEARPGKVYEFAEAPDDRFELVGTESAKRPDRANPVSPAVQGVVEADRTRIVGPVVGSVVSGARFDAQGNQVTFQNAQGEWVDDAGKVHVASTKSPTPEGVATEREANRGARQLADGTWVNADGTPGVAESTPQAPFDASIIPDDPKGA